jgi:hypothetical protein
MSTTIRSYAIVSVFKRHVRIMTLGSSHMLPDFPQSFLLAIIAIDLFLVKCIDCVVHFGCSLGATSIYLPLAESHAGAWQPRYFP